MSDVRDFGRERSATFSAPLHRAAVDLLPGALGAAFGGGTFGTRVMVEGCLDAVRELSARATLIIAPTHASNLDSIVLGLVLGRAGMPPFAYAAGKHIFRNRLLAAVMRRLGAYCLDPDRRDRLYLRVVQVYANELVARGYHTVVFPSGTRCRSGEVESAVKLGLLGAAVHVARPIAIVPVTINYQVVLEAEPLIAYYLAGRAHERIVGDELFVWGRLGHTARRLSRLDQRVVIRFGEPIDPRADEGPWRPRVARALTTAYRRDSVFLATHIVARALHDLDHAELPGATVLAAIESSRTRTTVARSRSRDAERRARRGPPRVGVVAPCTARDPARRERRGCRSRPPAVLPQPHRAHPRMTDVADPARRHVVEIPRISCRLTFGARQGRAGHS
ncbi:MAG: hypothetical protein E6J91_37275 [Deltaproteobacteria bacterium]|nr:MAG: hypothetical protein E6J91_37275 [Deltaproteobacteria bacterium]